MFQLVSVINLTQCLNILRAVRYLRKYKFRYITLYHTTANVWLKPITAHGKYLYVNID